MSPQSGSSPRPWGTHARLRDRRQEHRFIPTPVGNTVGHGRTLLRQPVHPHARGEHDAEANALLLRAGSSPRPWGTPQHLVAGFAEQRFIPTPVGNTAPLPSTGVQVPVHPHARGEHFMPRYYYRRNNGSSPRPWGTRGVAPRCVRDGRFIPTPVGNTAAISVSCRAMPVHPHARGEHNPEHHPVHRLAGSSPRPWGTLYGGRAQEPVRRFIPTPVGNTFAPSRLVSSEAGSSPRPWGTRLVLGRRLSTVRFIPTPVGNTESHRSITALIPVHPHARGEHTPRIVIIAGTRGSSPRPWGTRPDRTSSRRRSAVHPHARGEHGAGGPVRWRPIGSSPRPWGTRQAMTRRTSAGRFIPTPVGNTMLDSTVIVD